jgi:hypothetical protein
MVATKELTLALMETTYAIYGDVSTQNVIRLVSGPRLILREGVADSLSGAISGVQKSATGGDIMKLVQVAMVLAPVVGGIITTAKVGAQVFKISSFIMTHSTRTVRFLLKGKESIAYKDWYKNKLAKLNLRYGDDPKLVQDKLNKSYLIKLTDMVTKASHATLGDMDPRLKLGIVLIALLIAGLPFGITQRIFNMLKKAVKFGFKAAKAAAVWLFTFIRHLLFGKSQADIQKEEEEARKEEEFLKSLEGEE